MQLVRAFLLLTIEKFATDTGLISCQAGSAGLPGHKVEEKFSERVLSLGRTE
jgi:hypothetical protein